MTLTPAQIELHQRYLELMHAVQSGIATLIELDLKKGSIGEIQSSEETPYRFLIASNDASLPLSIKHMRMGVDSAHVSDAALVKVLIAKGVITYDEYYASLVETAEEEVEGLRRTIGQRLGCDPQTIKLM